MAGWIKIPLGREVGLSPSDIVLDGDPAPLSERERSPPPNFRPVSIVAKRLDGSRCHLVGRQASAKATLCCWRPSSPLPKTGAEPPIFGRVYCGQTAGWIKMPLGVEVGLCPGHIVLHGAQLFLPQRCTAPNFRPISVVAKWLDGSRCHLVGR